MTSEGLTRLAPIDPRLDHIIWKRDTTDRQRQRESVHIFNHFEGPETIPISTITTNGIPIHRVYCSVCGCPLISVPANDPSARNRVLSSTQNPDFLSQHNIATLSSEENAVDVGEFINYHVGCASIEHNIVPHLDASSAIVRRLGNIPLDIAVTHLYGCTSMIIVSRKGLWISHFWEIPAFQDNFVFGQDVLRAVVTGVNTPIEPGSRIPSLPSLTELLRPGGMFAAPERPTIIIVTPRLRTAEYSRGSLNYPGMVNQLSVTMRMVMSHAESTTVFDYYAFYSETLLARTGKGTILVHYAPGERTGSSSRPESHVNVYVDGIGSSVRDVSWFSPQDQIISR